MRHAGMVLMREPAMSSSPAGLVSGHLAVLSAIAPGPADAVRAGLLEALSQVMDPRDRRGVRYDLVAVLAAAVCATPGRRALVPGDRGVGP